MPRATPIHTTPSGIRRMELIGVDENGVMSLWSEDDVLPLSRFPTIPEGGRAWIESGHYVIEWKGHAITVHCGNLSDGTVSVQFMCSAAKPIPMRRGEVEAMLIGQVVKDPEHTARIVKMIEEATKAFVERKQAPHRLRGRIG